MTWTYQQSTGYLYNAEGLRVGDGYSGNGEGLNHPGSEGKKGIGPIPSGYWLMGKFYDSPGDKGPLVCDLFPGMNTNTLGRSGFMIHGDNEAMDHTASDGCIVLNSTLRRMIAESRDCELMVIE